MREVLLIPEPPIQVLPALAEAIGFNEAVVVQTLHYVLNPKINTLYREGRHWVVNLIGLLRQRFYFWDAGFIERLVDGLEKSGILITSEEPDLAASPEKSPMKYHTLNYTRLKEKGMASLSLLPVSPVIQDIFPNQNVNSNQGPSFTSEVYRRGPYLYGMVIRDAKHFLACDLTLEIHDKEPESEFYKDEPNGGVLASREIICHFPHIGDKRFQELIENDETLHGILMVVFQMRILEQLLLFCATHQAATLVIFADDAQAEELEIYRDFLVSREEVLTPAGEKTEMILPADRKTFDAWIDFMGDITTQFRQTLWQAQKTNPAIKKYLKLQGLFEV